MGWISNLAITMAIRELIYHVAKLVTFLVVRRTPLLNTASKDNGPMKLRAMISLDVKVRYKVNITNVV